MPLLSWSLASSLLSPIHLRKESDDQGRGCRGWAPGLFDGREEVTKATARLSLCLAPQLLQLTSQVNGCD